MAETMQAVVNHGINDFRLEEVPKPRISHGEVLIKVDACGVCTSDVKTLHGAERYWGRPGGKPFVKTPVIPGHEFFGTVVDASDERAASSGLRVGDRVVAEQIVPCGKCRFCKKGSYWMCEVHHIFGFQPEVNGGMADFMKFTAASIVHKLPDNLPLELAVLIEPLACAFHAVERARIEPGDVVVIAGAGTLGLGMIGPALTCKPNTLVVLDLDPKRLALAKALGATLVFDPREVDVAAEIRNLTDGYGCDVYIEATGTPKGVEQGLMLLRKQGRFLEYSVFGAPVTVDWSIIGEEKELDVLGAHLGARMYPSAIAGLADGSVKMDGVVTDRFSLPQYTEAFAKMEGGSGSIKAILVP
jgi:2-desacetyl-2-hydroxyethyl bacteriochlorophyllide A dehydrogenase